MKNILIIGSTSNVGIAVGRMLSALGHKIFYAGRKQADYFLDLNSADLTLPDHLQFDVVIHAAADFGGDSSENIYHAEKINAIGTLSVCQLAKRHNAEHMIVISSVSALYEPSDPYFGAYSLSKRHADELAQLYCNKVGLPLTILRPSQIYDSESHCAPHQRLFYLIVDRAQRGEDNIFHGKNDALRNYIFLDDFAEITVRVVTQNVIGTFNCPFPESVRLSEIAQTACRIFNSTGQIRFIQNEQSIPDMPTFTNTELYNLIGFKPNVNLADGIEKIKCARKIA